MQNQTLIQRLISQNSTPTLKISLILQNFIEEYLKKNNQEEDLDLNSKISGLLQRQSSTLLVSDDLQLQTQDQRDATSNTQRQELFTQITTQAINY